MRTLFVLFTQNPSRPIVPEISYCGAADSLGEIEPLMDQFEEGLTSDSVLVVARFTGEQADILRSAIRTIEQAEVEDREHEIEQLEARLEGYLFPMPTNDDSFDDSMDGDHESALASAGFGTDEDYSGGEGGE